MAWPCCKEGGVFFRGKSLMKLCSLGLEATVVINHFIILSTSCFTIRYLSLFFPGLGVFLYQRRHSLAEDHLLYPLVWFAGVFFFFSVALGKRGVYILPLYPAMALLFGAWWSLLEQGKVGGVKLTQWIGGLYALSWGIVITAFSIFFLGAFGLRDRLLVFFVER